MDDELPLTALAKPQKKSYDDDLPLVSLAALGGKKAGRPGVKPAAPGQGKVKPAARKAESSSSSGSSSSSDSSDSSSESGGKKKGQANKKKRLKLIAKKKQQAEEDGEDNKIKKRERSPKEQVVVDLLCRWWYAYPSGDWPPSDPAFYDPELNKRSLRRVSIQEWEWVPEKDEQGRSKVYELSQFKGTFRTSNGDIVDLRPMDTCPSHNNFMKKDMPELYSMLLTAYEAQIKDLANSKYDESILETQLKTGLTRIREKSHQANQMLFNTGAAAKKRKTE